MLTSVRTIASLGLVSILAACSGTGTTDTSEINELIRAADGNTAIVARNTGFAGSAPRIFVLMNGEQVSSLGNNEIDSFQAPPGRHELTLEYEGIDIGIKKNTLIYDNDPNRPQYFVITLKQGFVGAAMTISEVSASSFAAVRQ